MRLCGYHCAFSVLFSTSLMLLSIKKIIFPSHRMICESFPTHSLLFIQQPIANVHFKLTSWIRARWKREERKGNLASLSFVYFGFLNYVWDFLMKLWWVICCRGMINEICETSCWWAAEQFDILLAFFILFVSKLFSLQSANADTLVLLNSNKTENIHEVGKLSWNLYKAETLSWNLQKVESLKRFPQ
jgi:hypothetical protein